MADSALLLTGATGFLGSRLARALLARGQRLRVLHRPGRRAGLADLERDAAAGLLTPVEGELRDPDSLVRAAEGCTAILHAAARVSRSGSRADFEAVNVGGLERLLTAAERAGVSRIVYTSSFFALGPSDGGPPRDESALEEPLGSELDHYQASKARAARLALAEARAGRPIVTLLPGALVGPGPMTEGNFITSLLLDHLKRRPVPLPLGGRPKWSFVHVDDVAAAHLAALDAPAPPPALVLGGANVGLAELFLEVEALTGLAPPRLALPYVVLLLAGAGEELLERLVGRAPTKLTRGAARLLRHDWALDSGLAERTLAWRARSLGALVRDSIEWLQVSGMVPQGVLREAAS